MNEGSEITVRVPLSLFGAFRASAERLGVTTSEAVKILTAAASWLPPDQLRSLEEPPQEMETARLSFHLNWNSVDALMITTRNSLLTNSALFRRLLHGLLVTKEISFVQQEGQFKLRISSRNNPENTELIAV